MYRQLQILFPVTLALLLFQTTLSGQIVINEINYHSADDFDTKDWLEFYNANSNQVDLSNWFFKDKNDDNIFTFPEGTSIDGNGFLVVCRNDSAFTALWPNVDNYIGEFDFGLNNGGELIRLFDATGALADTVNYDDVFPWPVEADGLGPTLQLISPELDNALAESWFAPLYHGTPGAPNGPTATENLYREVQLQVAPNPFSSTAAISIMTNSTGGGEGHLLVINIFGKVVKTMPYNGEKEIMLSGRELPEGIYSLHLEDQKNKLAGVIKFMIIKF